MKNTKEQQLLAILPQKIIFYVLLMAGIRFKRPKRTGSFVPTNGTVMMQWKKIAALIQGRITFYLPGLGRRC
jgi:hypothetical protein